jgi:hypothetical protein
MEETLLAAAKADAAVIALAANRGTWSVRPQGGVLPDYVMHAVSGIEHQHMDGPANLKDARVQIDCLAQSYAEAKALARAMIALFNGQALTGIQGIFVEDQRDDSGPDADETMIFRTSVDLRVLVNGQ